MVQKDLDELWSLLNEVFQRDTWQGFALRNLIATACFLHREGHEDAGVRAFRSALEALGLGKGSRLYSALINNLRGNEAEIAAFSGAHAEIKDLFH